MDNNQPKNLEKKANDVVIFNLMGKLVGGWALYEIGKLIGGDYLAIVGAFTGLKLNYYLNPYRKENGHLGSELELTFKTKQ